MIERRKHNRPYAGIDRRRSAHSYSEYTSDDSSNDILNAVGTALAVESIVDAFSSDNSTSTDTSSSSDFGGFGGGDSGGGGASSDW